MNEFIRTIDRQEFEEGIERRLLVGQVAVGSLCKIRLQDMVETVAPPRVRYIEATISVLEKYEQASGSTILRYMFEASRDTADPIIYTDTFNHESIAHNHSYGLNLMTYLSDENDPRWDDSLQALVDTEMDVLVR